MICTVLSEVLPNILKFHDHNHCSVLSLELITFEILAAEQLRLMGFDNRLIIDCFSNVVNMIELLVFRKLGSGREPFFKVMDSYFTLLNLAFVENYQVYLPRLRNNQ